MQIDLLNPSQSPPRQDHSPWFTGKGTGTQWGLSHSEATRWGRSRAGRWSGKSRPVLRCSTHTLLPPAKATPPTSAEDTGGRLLSCLELRARGLWAACPSQLSPPAQIPAPEPVSPTPVAQPHFVSRRGTFLGSEAAAPWCPVPSLDSPTFSPRSSSRKERCICLVSMFIRSHSWSVTTT